MSLSFIALRLINHLLAILPPLLMALSNMFLVPLLIEWLASKKSAVSRCNRDIKGTLRRTSLKTLSRQPSHSHRNRTLIKLLFAFQVVNQFFIFVLLSPLLRKQTEFAIISGIDFVFRARNHQAMVKCCRTMGLGRDDAFDPGHLGYIHSEVRKQRWRADGFFWSDIVQMAPLGISGNASYWISWLA